MSEPAAPEGCGAATRVPAQGPRARNLERARRRFRALCPAPADLPSELPGRGHRAGSGACPASVAVSRRCRVPLAPGAVTYRACV